MQRISLFMLSTFTAFALPAIAFADTAAGSAPYGGWNGHMGGYGWGHGWGFLFPLLIIAIIIAVVMMMSRGCRGHRCGSAHPSSDSKPAIDILRERFANGEIDAEEFKEKKRVLEE